MISKTRIFKVHINSMHSHCIDNDTRGHDTWLWKLRYDHHDFIEYIYLKVKGNDTWFAYNKDACISRQEFLYTQATKEIFWV